MQKVGIIQPGRLGDVIICLPIARYYNDRGFTVVWPMFDYIAEMVSSVVDYVKIIPVSSNIYTAVTQARNELEIEGIDRVIDIAATFPGSDCTQEYVRMGDGLGSETFDAFKYRLAGVPISEKWNLYLNRNIELENDLYEKYVKHKNYVVTSLSHSKGRANIHLDVSDYQIIDMNSDHNIFHWIKILQNAKGIVCVESSVSNLVEQLSINCRKVLIKKTDGRLPVLRTSWRII